MTAVGTSTCYFIGYIYHGLELVCERTVTGRVTAVSGSTGVRGVSGAPVTVRTSVSDVLGDRGGLLTTTDEDGWFRAQVGGDGVWTAHTTATARHAASSAAGIFTYCYEPVAGARCPRV